MDSLVRILIPFLMYGFLGWLLMTIVHTVRTGRLVLAGFLAGPFCPAFGLSAVILLWLAPSLAVWPPLVFIVGTLLAIVTDVMGSWVMLWLFQVQWRGDKPGNGLRLVTLWLGKAMAAGLLGSLLIYVVHPNMIPLIAAFTPHSLGIITMIGAGIFLLDFLYSLDILDKLTIRLRSLHYELGRFDSLYESQESEDKAAWAYDIGWLRSLKEAGRLSPEERDALSQIDALTAMWRPGFRLMLALPQLQPVGLAAEKTILRKEWIRHSAVDESWFHQMVVRAKAKFTSQEAKDAVPFAKGVGFYKLLWVFVVACVLGFLIETVFALVNRGVLENRTGMVYGPFNQVYGFGAVLMVILLHPLAKKKDRWLFLASALLGGVYEFACSWIQEFMFGTYSWNYTGNPTSIGGRTSLTLMLWWGVLGVVFIKGIYPWLSGLIERIPRRPGLVLTWIIALFLATDLAISGAAVGRWVGRQEEQPPQSTLDTFLDKRFPDETMELIYPSMEKVMESIESALAESANRPTGSETACW